MMILPESDSDKYAVTEIWEYYLLCPKYDFGYPKYKYSDGKLSYELQGEIIPMNYVGNDVNGLVESVNIITKLMI